MALEGTLQDFGLADIFQLIAIQQKTGVLTLQRQKEDVSVYFRQGDVVFADAANRNLEDRLGRVLVRSGQISAEQLQRALEAQKSTLQRLGQILVEQGALTEAQLAESLELQVTRIVYRLFRWSAGDYNFRQEEDLDLDRNHSTLISAQNILMEGVRIIDEWPMLERRIPSFQVVFEKVNGSLALSAMDDEDVDLRFDDLEEAAPVPQPGTPVRVSPSAAQLYELVNGEASVEELFDCTQLGEFDTCRGLYELLEHDMIRPADRETATPAALPKARRQPRGILLKLGYLALLAAVALSVATMARNRLNLMPLPIDESPTVDSFRRLVSRSRIDRVDRALYLYFLEKHRFASSLEDVVGHGFLEPDGIIDPWGRKYAYQVLPLGYEVQGFDNGGVEDSTLRRVRRYPTGILPRD